MAIVFMTGAQRDTQDGKPRFDLIDLEWVIAVRRSNATLVSYDEQLRVLSLLAYPGVSTVGVLLNEIERFSDGMINIEYAAIDETWGYKAMERLALLLAKGADRYGEDNWRKGIPIPRVVASLHRHYWQWRDGQDNEDHFAAILFNCMALHYTLRHIKVGILPATLLSKEQSTEGLPNIVIVRNNEE